MESVKEGLEGLEALADIALQEEAATENQTESLTENQPKGVDDAARLENAKARAVMFVAFYDAALKKLKDHRLQVPEEKYLEAQNELAPLILHMGWEGDGQMVLPDWLKPYEPHLRAFMFGAGLGFGTYIQIQALKEIDAKASENKKPVDDGASGDGLFP